MSAGGISIAPEPALSRARALLFASVLRPLHALINAPVLIFLAALAAMLFRPPDLRVFPYDRVAFLLIITVFALRVCLRREQVQIYSATWPMLALMILALLGALGDPDPQQAWSLFTAKWIVPFALFHIAASVFRAEDALRKLEKFSLAVLVYLTLISIFQLLNLSSLIYPQFILDESIGIHADRARGPMLQAVANGVCLNIFGLVALDSFRRRTLPRILAPFLFFAVPLALLATRTRAVWLSAAVSVVWIARFAGEHRLRRPAIAMCSIGLVLACGGWMCTSDSSSLCDRLLDRSPLDFRLDMYRAGWQMFLEKPIAGWGGEATVQPEIERRISSFHPERYLFHNTYLELAVERGVVGLGLYAWLMVCLFRLGRFDPVAASGAHFLDTRFRQLWPVILIVYLINASAVVMNYQFVNGFVFTIAGILSAQTATHNRMAL